MNLTTLDNNLYAAVYDHKGLRICVRKETKYPRRGMYCIDHIDFEGRFYDYVNDAIENINEWAKTHRK